MTHTALAQVTELRKEKLKEKLKEIIKKEGVAIKQKCDVSAEWTKLTAQRDRQSRINIKLTMPREEIVNAKNTKRNQFSDYPWTKAKVKIWVIWCVEDEKVKIETWFSKANLAFD